MNTKCDTKARLFSHVLNSVRIILAVSIITIMCLTLFRAKASEGGAGSIEVQRCCGSWGWRSLLPALRTTRWCLGGGCDRQMIQPNAKLRQPFGGAWKRIFINRRSPYKNSFLPVNGIRQDFFFYDYNGAVDSFWPQCHMSLWRGEREVIRIWQVGEKRLIARLDNNIACWGITSVGPYRVDFLSYPPGIGIGGVLYYSWPILRAAVSEEGSLRNPLCIIRGIGDAVEQKSENSKDERESSSPSCCFVDKQNIPYPLKHVIFALLILVVGAHLKT